MEMASHRAVRIKGVNVRKALGIRPSALVSALSVDVMVTSPVFNGLVYHLSAFPHAEWRIIALVI